MGKVRFTILCAFLYATVLVLLKVKVQKLNAALTAQLYHLRVTLTVGFKPQFSFSDKVFIRGTEDAPCFLLGIFLFPAD